MSGGGPINQHSWEVKSSRESPPAAFKGQRPRRHRELRFSEESPAKQMVGIQLVEYFCTLIKQFLCGPLNVPSLNEHSRLGGSSVTRTQSAARKVVCVWQGCLQRLGRAGQWVSPYGGC